MRLLFTLFALSTSVLAQTDTPVTVAGVGPRGSAAATNITHKSARVTYAIGSGTIDGIGKVDLPISISSRTGQLATALQFDVSYVAADVSSITFAIGSAGTAASKTLTCAAQTTTPPSVRCVLAGTVAAGLTTGIADGVVAIATVQTRLISQATTTVAMFGTVSASVQGSSLPTAVTAGGGTISMPALLATLTCGQTDVWSGMVVSCSATLNKPAPAGGASVALTSSDALLVSAPSSVQVVAGATSGTFSLTVL